MTADAGRPKVVALDLEWSPLDLEATALEQVGATLEEHHCRTEDEIVEAARGAVALLTEIAPVTRRVLEQLPSCRVVAEFGVGPDSIDVAAAAELGIYVTNVPDYCTDEVADHTIALALCVLRRIFEQRDLVRRGSWNSLVGGSIPRLAGATWGVVGFGRIGRAVAARAAAFGFRVTAYDPYVPAALIGELGAVTLDLHALLSEVDILSLHAPRTPNNWQMIGKRELGLLKPSAVLVNVARGHLVDEAALLGTLDAEGLAGVGLDVLADEPPGFDHPLVNHPRAVVTPHMAWYSDRALLELRSKGVAAVVDVLSGRRPSYVVAEPVT